jgi:hypothetical protein
MRSRFFDEQRSTALVKIVRLQHIAPDFISQMALTVCAEDDLATGIPSEVGRTRASAWIVFGKRMAPVVVCDVLFLNRDFCWRGGC